MEDQQRKGVEISSPMPYSGRDNYGIGCAVMCLVSVTFLTVGMVQFYNSYLRAEKPNQTAHKSTYTVNNNHIYNSTNGLIKKVVGDNDGN